MSRSGRLNVRKIRTPQDGAVRLWQAVDGGRVGADLPGHSDIVNSAQFSPDDSRIVSASDDGDARMYWTTVITRPRHMRPQVEASPEYRRSPNQRPQQSAPRDGA